MSNLSLATITTQEWPMVMEQAKMLCSTGFLPSAINTPEKAIAIMMKGRELGIPPMYALSNIAIIQGKPAASAELMLALIYRDHGDDAIQFVETTATVATISYKRRTWKERREHSFTAADAKAAGLTGGNWSKYPAAMLRARCISAVARLAFPDTISGMYTPDELGVETNIETGEYRMPAAPQLVDTRTGEILDTPEPAGYRDRGANGELVRGYQKNGGASYEPAADAKELTRREKLIARIAELTFKAEAADLDIILAKPIGKMNDDELVQHGKNLKAALDEAARSGEPVLTPRELAEMEAQQAPQRTMPEERLPESLPDVRRQAA